ncbi:DUF4230 domain-containing protein [Polaribacter sp. IC073]|uniref:DUF4230 domain-containing protein n=1 Tax=Polaribacter sp. IC073 TaxID=2508540 RepID=UPI0011BFC525|nr:DUF4230 domain-containing protein [Polaribacter sp. IC073]TXD46298.1 DUF4230 domain-containing protein [Polaribacter sp. IC073]
MRFLKYLAVFLFGFFIAKYWYQEKTKNYEKEEIQIVINSIKNLSKLVVSRGTFSEVYNYSDSKKYFYDYLSFDKKVIITVNALVEVGYDLSKLEIQIDSLQRKIYINKIPDEEITISPDVKYFDLQQSQFNTFSKEDLNKINQKSIEKIKETIEVTNLKEKAKIRLFEELSKIYQLSVIYNWQVVDHTKSGFLKIPESIKNQF